MQYTRCSSVHSADLLRMTSLARRFPNAHLHSIDLPYRLASWALDEPANAALWLDPSGEPAAWAVLQTPFWAFDLGFHAAATHELRRLVLDWADARASQTLATAYGHPCWFVSVFEDDLDTRKALEHAGFSDQYDDSEEPWSKVWLQRPAALPVKSYRIPNGFTVRALAGEAEVEAYVALHQVTFGSKNMTVEWRRRTLAQADYSSDLDIVVDTPDGRLGAFCIGWLDRSGAHPRGQIEPLGCHPDFRNFALGRLALVETLRRLQAAGARTIYVETDNERQTARALYESLDFTLEREVHVWRKDYIDTAHTLE